MVRHIAAEGKHLLKPLKQLIIMLIIGNIGSILINDKPWMIKNSIEESV